MHSILAFLSEQYAEAFKRCGFDPALAVVTVADRPDLAQFQCNGALAIAKNQKQKPREVAQQVIDALPDRSFFESVSIAGPGFINMTMKDEWVSQWVNEQLASYYTDAEHGSPKKIILDFGGANIAKPLHVGHLRTAIIGESLKRLLRFVGHEVIGDIHMGDWGTQMGIVICELKRRGTDTPVTVTELAELYPLGAKRIKEDATAKQEALAATAELQNGNPEYRALWEHIVQISVEALKRDYADLEVEFDWWYGESHYHDRIEPMIQRLMQTGVAVESDGAIVIPLGEEMPPLLLKKSDGAYLYSTTDLAAVEERMQEDHADLLLYVVDQRQDLHFQQVFAAAEKVGYAKREQLRFLGLGTMNGADGKPFKTREGGVIKLRDLITMVTDKARQRMEESQCAQEYDAAEKEHIAQLVGVASLKFADLLNTRQSNYMFDLETFSRFEGKTGPYLLYTTARIQSILRKAGEIAPVLGMPTTDIERQLMLTLTAFPDVIAHVTREYTPHLLAEHLYLLAQQFNQFYSTCHILSEEDAAKKQHWLALSQQIFVQLESGLKLLGIRIPERM